MVNHYYQARMRRVHMAKISIVGGGSWGLAIALMLYKQHHQVSVWEYNPDHVQKLVFQRKNDDFLNGIIFPEGIFFTNHLPDLFSHELAIPQNNIYQASVFPEILVFAVPSSFLRATVRKVKEYLPPRGIKGIVILTKGLEENSLKRMSEVLTEELPSFYADKICTLSGPSHAEEVSRGVPTLVVVAGNNPEILKIVQKTFSNSVFRVYTSDDLVGVEIGAAVKNIISIAAGVVAGLNFGDNTMGALLTRGLAEIKRLGLALNGKSETFSGLSGLGDLVTTSISQHSRNRFVGYQLAQGKTLDEIVKNMVQIAEGIITTKNIRELKEKLGISMPITEEMYQLLYHSKPPLKALLCLMTRDLKNESD